MKLSTLPYAISACLLILFSSASPLQAQTDLITNGGFETTPLGTGWSAVSTGTNLYIGQGACSAHGGSNSVWLGDNSQQTGVNSASQDMYQTLTFPSSASFIVVGFWASINTSESGSTAADFMYVNLRSSTGALLATLKTLDNTNAASGIPGCQAWTYYSVNIPSSHFGTTKRVSFEFTTDNANPTIFRIDDISVISTICTFNFSQNTYTCPNPSAATYNNIAQLTCPAGCTWTSSVTSGNAWLTCTSSGTGNGNVSITVAQNTSVSQRVGTVLIQGSTITITQPGTCPLTLSQTSYTCPNAAPNTFVIATLTTNPGCTWTAVVTSGTNFMSTTSSGTGNGSISITTQQNTSVIARSGTVSVNGQNITVTQPGNCNYTVSKYVFDCPNELATTYGGISVISPQPGSCTWTAVVQPGSPWLTTTSSGTGIGAVDIKVEKNSGTAARTGYIDVGGKTLTVNQPAACAVTLSALTYTCPNAVATTHSDIINVTAASTCKWTAIVLTDSAWLSTASSATGSGKLSITVTKNNDTASRTGTIWIGGQTITITQPARGVGIDEAELVRYSVYPNPANDVITVTATARVEGKAYNITDQLGRTLLIGKIENSGISIRDLKRGIYFLRFGGGGNTVKFIKE